MEKQVSSGMRTFLIVWIGQVVSLTGSQLASFAIGIWVYQETGVVMHYALIFVFTVLPRLLVTPISGALTDRWNRRQVMILSDVGAAVASLVFAILFFTGYLEIWHIYVIIAVNSAFNGFQLPAYTAATTQLVSKELLPRASGLMQLGRGIALLLSPVLGGILLVAVDLTGIIIIDFATFFFALITLAVIRIPDVKSSDTSVKGTMWQESLYAWNYLKSKRGLLGIGFFFIIANFLIGIIQVLVTPMILALTTPDVLGIAMSIAGTGMLVGGIVMGAWKGPQRLIYAVIGPLLLNGVWLIIGGLRPSLVLITVSAFLFFCGLPLINGYSQVILQKKVPLDLQGRVFALINMMAESALPIAYLMAGPLADLFEPLLAVEGLLAGSVGSIIGVGPGRGIALLFILIGFLTVFASLLCYAYPRLRLVEVELPDIIDDDLPITDMERPIQVTA
jgi:MFS transporter, DHA3 family, macrolide efflux protein